MASTPAEGTPEIEYHELVSNKPTTITLAPKAHLQLYTLSGRYIASISNSDQGVILQGSDGGQIHLSESSYTEIGTVALGADFFGPVSTAVSRFHSDLQINKIEDGVVTLTLTDLDSTNGTMYRMVENNNTASTLPSGLEEETGQRIRAVIRPENKKSGIQIIARGAEDKLESPNEKCRAITLKGPRTNNEDGFLVSDDLIAVADGMGGEEKGEIASGIVLDSLAEFGPQRLFHLPQLFEAMCSDLSIAGLKPKSGTTLAVVRKTELEGNLTKFEAVHVGDTKILGIIKSTGEIQYESKDQSWVQARIDARIDNVKLEPIDRYTHPKNNVISKCLSSGGIRQSEVGYTEEICENGEMVWIIYGDGVGDYVSPEEVRNLYMSMQKDPVNGTKHFPEELAKFALSRQQSKDGFMLLLHGETHKVKIEDDYGDNVTVTLME